MDFQWEATSIPAPWRSPLRVPLVPGSQTQKEARAVGGMSTKSAPAPDLGHTCTSVLTLKTVPISHITGRRDQCTPEEDSLAVDG